MKNIFLSITTFALIILNIQLAIATEVVELKLPKSNKVIIKL